MNLPSNYSFRPILLELFTKPYTYKELREDVIAGLTVGLVALPLTIGFSVASIPSGTITPYEAPTAGIFTAIIAGILIGIFGGDTLSNFWPFGNDDPYFDFDDRALWL